MSEICERVREEAALLGRAPDELREHTATCPACSEFLENLSGLSSELAGLRSRDASDELVAKTLARPELRRTRKINWRPWALSLGAAASLFLLIRSYPHALRDEESFRAMEVPVETEGGAAGGLASPQPSTPELRKEEIDRLKSLGYISGDELSAHGEELSPQSKIQILENKLERVDEPQKQAEAGKKDRDAAGGRVGSGILLDEKRKPARRAQREPVYPEAAKNSRVQGTVVLELTVDKEGNVASVRVIDSIPALDQAAIDAVREWKYEPSADDVPRVFRVSVPFRLEEPKEDEDRGRVDGLPFQEPKGYWANTYVPGDPMLRSLALALRGSSYPALHEEAHPALLPLDPTSTGALSLFLHADRRGIREKSRLLVQVGIRASDRSGRRRPPMNVGVVLDLPQPVPQEVASAATALLESLESSRELGDRFRLVVPGQGEVLAPESFRRGPLEVALRDLYSESPSGSVSDALCLALEKVHAGDDPTMPLGTSLVLLITGREIRDELPTLSLMAQASAVGGVSVTTVGVGSDYDEAALERLALDGQGRRYAVDRASDGPGIIDRELSSASRAVARAIRLRIQLAEGVHLVDVLGSEPLNARESERVRTEERSIDLRLARNLGIEADRGKDEDGIQIVIPAFYAGDAHSILLDVVADGPGPIAEVTARYKDLVQLENTVARASLALPRSEALAGPLEASVENDYLEFRVAQALRAASEAVERGDTGMASATLQRAMAFARERDRSMLGDYLRFLPQLPASYLRDSLLYASALKRTHFAS